MTWERNPSYWKSDPLLPESRLPYIDKMNVFVIPDVSTRQAALRAGKLDVLTDVSPEQVPSLKRTNPELQWARIWEEGKTIYFAHDTAPFDNLKVRQALMLAIDHDELVKDYYQGEATKWYDPSFPVPEQKDYWIELAEMPPNVQELYGYHPDKAKQLLAEAGYPRGFKTSVNVSGAEEDDIDLLAVIKAYWGKVGVDMEIRVTEATVFATMTRNTSYEHGFMGSHLTPGSTISRFVRLEPNRTIRGLNDPWINNYMRAVAKTMAVDYKEKVRLFRELTPELHRRVDMIRLPLVTTYVVWQPWVKNFEGRNLLYTSGEQLNAWYVWIDQELKQKMTGRE